MPELLPRPPEPEKPKAEPKITPQIVTINTASFSGQHINYGCPPTCSICYPQNNGRSPNNYFSSINAAKETEEYYRRLMEQIQGSTIRMPTWDFSISTQSPPKIKPKKPVKAPPPESYTSARKLIEKYIVPAQPQAFSDIIGNDAALAQLRDAIEAPVKHKKLYKVYSMKMPKGALLSGPPGCGKTMFARAAAAEMKRLYKTNGEYISAPASGLQGSYIGETEQRIRNIFAFAREYKTYHGYPILVFLDEAETLFPDRTGRVRRVFSYEEAQVSTFLAEMDGVQECGAFVLLATNRPEVIDQALLRDGRCDFKVVIKRPNAEAIESILRNNFKSTLTAVDKEDLIFAALEGLFDPSKIIAEAHAIGIDMEQIKLVDAYQKHFLLEHIISGAMAASIPSRATRYAFARDKFSGKALGVTVSDVLQAVNDLFEENKRLEHSFAVAEFKEAFMAEAQKKQLSKEA